jgi:hypothetical protein
VSPTPDHPTILGLDPSAGASPWAWALLDDARALVGAGGVAGRGEAVALALHLRPALVAVAQRESACFARRGSGVRIPSAPPPEA